MMPHISSIGRFSRAITQKKPFVSRETLKKQREKTKKILQKADK